MAKHDLWRVRIGPAVVEMSLDELVAAFQGGQIEPSTLVIAPGDLRWSTLSAVADLGDDNNDGESDASPPSVAPMAYDTGDVDIRFGEEATLPAKKRRVGRISAVVATYAVLIAVGAGAGAYRAAPGEVRAKVSSVRAKVTRSKSAPAAAVAATQPPAPVVAPPPSPPSAPPAPAVVAEPAPTQVGTSINSLPTAKPAAVSKPVIVTKAAPPRRRTH